MVSLLSVVRGAFEVVGAVTEQFRPSPIYPPLDSRTLVANDMAPDLLPVPEGEDLDIPEPQVNGEPEELLQWGLKLPNGNIVWDNALYCGRPLATPEQRAILVANMETTACQLGFDEESFLALFGWVRRVAVPTLACDEVGVISLTGASHERGGNVGQHDSSSSQTPCVPRDDSPDL